MPERWQDVAIGPLRCVVCGRTVYDLDNWVRPNEKGPIYGLHTFCADEFRERGSWEDGRPRMKQSLEDRVKALERQFDAHLHVKSLYRS